MESDNHSQGEGARLPKERVDRFIKPFVEFLHVESASGIVLLICTMAAVILANSPFSEGFLGFWKTQVGFEFGTFQFRHSLQHLINDGLMVIFFFVIGLEVKREMVLGQLREIRNAALPIAAALGGMIFPAGLYLVLQMGEPGARGWGIPMATDIAFVVGCMALLGPRIPRSLRVMLLSLAIVDDIGAILVIAIGYTENLNLLALFLGVLGIGIVVCFQWLGVRSIGIYTILGTLIWLAFHESGVHATIAGVILGLMTPSGSWVNKSLVAEIIDKTGQFLHGDGFTISGKRYSALRNMELATREALSPLERLEHTLHPWVAFGIMPIFALANAGVPIQLSDVAAPVSVAVIVGLFVGKPLGIVLMSWLAVKAGLARLPEGVSWGAIAAGGFLAGIGFTMALFIAGLALEGDMLDTAKIGVLAASLLSAVVGMTAMILVLGKKPAPAA